MNVNAVKYLNHINEGHMLLTGEQLAFRKVPCPTCESMLVKRNRKGTDIMFVACDKTNLPYCRFSIGMDETLLDRSRRIYLKLRHKDIINQESSSRLHMNGIVLSR